KEIARKGGRAAHERGTAHRFSEDEARAAGRKGGAAVSQDRSHMAEIGRAGGLARGRRGRHPPPNSSGGEPAGAGGAPGGRGEGANGRRGGSKPIVDIEV